MTRNLIVSLLSNCLKLIMLMVYLKEVVHGDLYLQSSVVTRFYLKCNKKKNIIKILYYYVINNGNRAEWSPIRSVIKRVINKIA